MEQEQIVSSKNKLIAQIDKSLNSGDGILCVETSEQMRAMEVMNEYAYAKNTTIGIFKFMKGFVSFEEDSDGKQKVLGSSGANCALSVYEYMEDPTRKEILVIPMSDHILSKTPTLIQALNDANMLCPSLGSNKRVIFIVPVGYDLPTELNQTITVRLERPSKGELREIYDDIVDLINEQGSEIDNMPYSENEIDTILNIGMGMTAQYFLSAISSVIYSKRRKPTFEQFIEHMNNSKVEIINKSSVLSISKSIPMNQIGGLDILKEDMVVLANSMTLEASQLNIDTPKGIGIFGGPGIGKSLSASAIANILNVPFIRFDISRVFGSLVGSSEKSMKEALELISSIKNCVVLCDEIDKIFSTSGANDSGTSARVLGTLLSFMQDNNSGAFFVFTANRTDNLPPEMLRRGRLDQLYSVTTPTRSERDAVFKIHLEKRGVTIPSDLHLAVEASENYVSSEIESSIIEAMRIRYSEKNNVDLTSQDIISSLQNMNPLTSVFSEQFALMDEWSTNHARACSYPEMEGDVPPNGTDENVTSIGRRKRTRVLN